MSDTGESKSHESSAKKEGNALHGPCFLCGVSRTLQELLQEVKAAFGDTTFSKIFATLKATAAFILTLLGIAGPFFVRIGALVLAVVILLASVLLSKRLLFRVACVVVAVLLLALIVREVSMTLRTSLLTVVRSDIDKTVALKSDVAEAIAHVQTLMQTQQQELMVAERMVSLPYLDELGRECPLGDSCSWSEASREYLTSIVTNKSEPWARRGNAAIVLLRLGDYDSAKAVFQYKDDPSAREWVVGAAHLWIGQVDPKRLLDSIGSDTEEIQTRTGALAALGIAGPDVFTQRGLTDDVRSRLKTTLRQVHGMGDKGLGNSAPGLLNHLRWTLRRFGCKLDAATSGPRWNKNDAGIVMIYFSGCRYNPPGPGEFGTSVGPFSLSATEITSEVFGRFIREFRSRDGSPYKTSAEAAGTSSTLEYPSYEWTLVDNATWQNPKLQIDEEKWLTPAADDHLPVMHVSWIDAVHFCNWLSSLEGLQEYYTIGTDEVITRNDKANGYRLPTVVEWKCAAHADSTTKFWWGRFQYLGVPDWRKDPDWKGWVANIAGGELSGMGGLDKMRGMMSSDEYAFVASVATFRPNPFGLFDRIGNVAEWCDDDAQEWCPDAAPEDRVIVGGSWADDLETSSPYFERCHANAMNSSHVNVGFRVARNGR